MVRPWLGRLLVVSILLSGCSVQRAVDAERAKSELVGMSQEKVLSCMGVPLAERTVGRTTVWQYASGGDVHSTAVAQQVGGTTVAAGNSRQRYCEISVVMRGGKVEAVNYTGRTGGLITHGEQCAFAVNNCLS